MDIKRQLVKVIDDWIEDNCINESEYENLSTTTSLVVDIIVKKIQEDQKLKQFQYSHTMPFMQCNGCGRPFGEWKNAHHTFTDEKLYEPGTKINLPDIK